MKIISADLKRSAALALAVSGLFNTALAAENSRPAAGDMNVAQATPDSSASALKGLENVVVTARRKEENLQNVPVAISVVSMQSLERAHVETTTDLQRLVPALSLTGVTRDNPSYSFRGLTNMAGGSSVVSYFNEVPDLGPPIGGGYSSSGGAGPGLFYDLENVQVLLGPQGTLFGQNTVGGAVLFTPTRPSHEFGGYLRLQGGSYSNREVQGAINLPLIQDKLAVRVAGSVARRDGFTKDLRTGIDLDDRSYEAARVSVLFTPTDRFTNYLVLNGVNTDQNGTITILSDINPAFRVGGVLRTDIYPTLLDVLAAQREASPGNVIGIYGDGSDGIAGNGDNLRTAFKLRKWYVSNTSTYEFDNGLTLKNILGFQRMQFLNRRDGDGSPFPISQDVTPDGLWNNQLQQLTEEFQLQGTSFDDNLIWVTGLYFQKVKPFGMQETYSIANGSLPANPRYTASDARAESYALFAQGTYDLSERILDGLKLTLGFRHTWDERSSSIATRTPQGCTAPGTMLPDCRSTGSGKFTAPSWTATLDYQVDASTLVYLSHRRGYVAGGQNPTTLIPGTENFDPAYLDDIELGLKVDWNIGNMLVRTNVDIYRGWFSDMQINTNLRNPIPPFNTQGVIQNAADAIRQGVEFQSTFVPFDDLELTAMWAYQDNYYSSYRAQGVVIDRPTLAAAPEHKVALSATYALPLEQITDEISLTASWTYQSSIFHTTTNLYAQGIKEDPYALLNLSLDWKGVFGSAFDVSAYVTNVTDKLYRSGASVSYLSSGYTADSYGEPRMWGARLNYNF